MRRGAPSQRPNGAPLLAQLSRVHRAQQLLLALTAALLTLFAPAGAAEQVVGVFAPLSGPHAHIGQSMRNGVVLALEQAEDSGRFGEVRLSIRALDDTGAPKAVAERVARFVRDELAILVIGPALSTHAEAVADLANHAQFPLLAPGASEGITAAGKWSFRLSMSPYKTLHALAAHALAASGNKSGVRLALVHAKGNAGFAAQAAQFRAAAVRSGAQVVADVAADIDTDFVNQTATAVRDAGASLVFFAMDAEPGAALAQAIASRASATLAQRPAFAFAPAAAQPALARIGGAAVEGAFTAADYLPEAHTEANTRFRTAYQARFGTEAEVWAGIGYAAGQLAAEAIRNAGPSPNAATVRLALERVNQLELVIGGGRWQQDATRNPAYTPQIYVMREGKLAPIK